MTFWPHGVPKFIALLTNCGRRPDGAKEKGLARSTCSKSACLQWLCSLFFRAAARYHPAGNSLSGEGFPGAWALVRPDGAESWAPLGVGALSQRQTDGLFIGHPNMWAVLLNPVFIRLHRQDTNAR